MNRRSFLKHLGLLTAAAATPKLIFDMGANSHIYKLTGWEWINREIDSDPFRIAKYCSTAEINPEWEEAPYEEIVASYKEGYWNTKIIKQSPYFERRFLEGLAKKYVVDVQFRKPSS